MSCPTTNGFRARDNLYRVEMTTQVPAGRRWPMAVIPYAMPEAMRDEIPGVTGMTRVYQNSMTLTVGDRQFRENVDVGGSRFLQVDPFSAGRRRSGTVFRQPQSLVLSQSAARKYFGNADPHRQDHHHRQKPIVPTRIRTCRSQIVR